MRALDYMWGVFVLIVVAAVVAAFINGCTPSPALTPDLIMPPISDNIGWVRL